MPKCPNCKTVLSDKLTICTECGTRLNSVKKQTLKINKEIITSVRSETSLPKKIDPIPKEIKSAEIPSAHYYYLLVSIFFSIFWFVPLIGVFLSVAAFSSLTEQQAKGIDVGSHVGYTIAAGVVHAVYVIVSLVMG